MGDALHLEDDIAAIIEDPACFDGAAAISSWSPATSPPKVVSGTASGGSPSADAGNSTRSGLRWIKMFETSDAAAAAEVDFGHACGQ